jgi:hypothetical protein
MEEKAPQAMRFLRSCKERKRCWARACWTMYSTNLSKEKLPPTSPLKGKVLSKLPSC